MEAYRRFHFFDKKLVQVHAKDDNQVKFESVVDTASSEAFLWILESFGRIHVLHKPLGADYASNVLKCHSFKIFENEAIRVFSCSKIASLVVVGKDEESNHMLKFNIYGVKQRSAFEKPDEILQFVQSVSLFPKADDFPPDPVESIAVSACATVAVVATSNGSVYIYRNYLLPSGDYSNSQKSNLCKLNINDYSNNRKLGAIRCLYLKKLFDDSFALALCLENAVLSIRLGSESSLSYTHLLESRYEASCDIDSNGCFATAQSDGYINIYDYENGLVSNVRTSGSCSSLCSYKGYIASASLENNNMLENSYTTTQVMIRSIIPDMEFLAHSQYIPVVFKFDKAMGSLYVLTRYGANNAMIIFELREKGVHERIQVLIRKRMFQWAINMATLERCPIAEREEIHKIHAAWLYEHGDYNGSIEAYCKAGLSVEPAFVIDRFMCLNSKIPLYKYLLHIHRQSMATNEHTVLLMRALQSLFRLQSGSDVTRSMTNDEEPDCQTLLSGFLDEFGGSHKDGIRDALYECRSSGGSEFARLVALAQHDHDEYINILVEDFQDYKGALEHLRSVDNNVICNAILKHGRRLVKYDPQGIMMLIHQICDSAPQTDGNVHDAFVPVFAMEDKFLGDMIGLEGSNNHLLIFSTRLHLMLDQLANNGRIGDGQPNASGTFDAEMMENRLWKLLNANTQLTEYQLIALILCLVYNYQRGANAMAIKMGYYHLPLVLAGMPDSSIKGKKFDLFNHTLSYGYNEPTLWVGMLSLIIRSSEETSELVQNALQHIQNHQLLSFPSVLSILMKNPTMKFAPAKEYLRNEFSKISEAINDYRKDIAQDKIEYAQMNSELQRLQHSYFVVNNTNCSRCELSLEVPSLHFYCHHSFHSYCIGPENVCPKCSVRIQEDGSKQGNQESGEQDSFFKFLRGATDPFVYMTQQIERFSLY